MKTVAIINNKGGVGKTATAATLGHMIGEAYQKRVLLIDMDPQGNLSSRFSEINFFEIFRALMEGRASNAGLSIEDVLMDTRMDIHDAIKKTKYPNVDIIPAHITLSEVEERLKADITTPQQFKLSKQLKKVEDEYDFCLIDCSPSVSILNINGLTAASEVYIPVRCDADSCAGMAITKNLIETVSEYNPQLHIAGIFLTQYNNKKNVAKGTFNFLQSVSTMYDLPLIPITIGVTKYLEQVTFEQKPLLEADSGKDKCSATLAYMKLAEYMMAPNKDLFLKQYEEEIEKIDRLRKKEEHESIKERFL